MTEDGQRGDLRVLGQALKVRDLASGRELRTLSNRISHVAGVAVTPDGQCVVSAPEDNMAKVWQLETGEVLATFTCESAAGCCAFSDAQNVIVAGEVGGPLHFLRLEELKPKR